MERESQWIPRFPNVKAEVHQKILSVCDFMLPYSPSHAFFLDTIKEIYNKDASLFIHLKKVFIYLVSYGRNLGTP